MTTEEQVISLIKTLPLEQQQKALTYIESLQAELQQHRSSRAGVSVLEAAGDLFGAVEGPGDLSTNQQYMEGFGK